MANSLDIFYSNGIYAIAVGGQTVGRGRTLEKALANSLTSAPPPDLLHGAAEILGGLMGEPTEAHGQVATRAPGE